MLPLLTEVPTEHLIGTTNTTECHEMSTTSNGFPDKKEEDNLYLFLIILKKEDITAMLHTTQHLSLIQINDILTVDALPT